MKTLLVLAALNGSAFSLRLGQGALARMLAWQTDQMQPVDEFAMGSWVSGTSNVQGRNSVFLSEDPARATVIMHVDATADTSTLATNQPRADVTIYASMSALTPSAPTPSFS
jgi:hypothetical protein